MIHVDEVSKCFGRVRAVDRLSFKVAPGRVTGFLGPNGAGKSTTMRMMIGLARPTSGRITVGGREYHRIYRPLHQVGAALDVRAAHGGVSAYRHLLALAQSNSIGRRRVGEVLELVGLADVAGRRLGKFSLGMSQRLALAAALLGDPPVLICDEPVNGLDPEGIRWIRTLLRGLAAEGRTVLISSHLMAEMALTADHLVIIGQGRLLADTSTADLLAGIASHVVVRAADTAGLVELLTRAGATITGGGGGLQVTGLDSAAVGALALTAGIALTARTTEHGSLEAAYLALTHRHTDHGTTAPPLTDSRAT